MTMNANVPSKIVRVTLGGETIDCTEETWTDVADSLHAKHGGVPQVVFVDAAPALPAAPLTALALVKAPAPVVAPVSTDRGNDRDKASHDIIGEARSLADKEAAERAGFAVAQTIYRRGTRVIQLGVDNAREARVEYDAKPLVTEFCNDLVKRVAAERREDVVTEVADVRMNEEGDLDLRVSGAPHILVEERVLPAIVAHLQMPGGAGSYLAGVYPELRALNVNTWCKQWQADEKEHVADAVAAGEDPSEIEPSTFVLRTRVTGGERSAFAAVTESYTSFDVDRIAEAIKLATPDGARGTVTYDGYRARFEVLFHSNVRPEEYVAGEFFKAGVVIGTDDTGGGSLWGNAVVFQNLCLNLIVIDEAKQDLFRIRHVGNVRELARRFAKGFEEALAKVEHFSKAWGFAAREDLMKQVPASEKGTIIRLEDALPGFFNGCIERELVPVRGRRPEVVKQLVQAWEADKSSATRHHGGLTRAAIANAFTRFAHDVPQSSPWIEDEIQRAAGALITGKVSIPYVPVSK